MPDYIGALDQGTTSTRFLVFDRDGRIVSADQREHEQITPRAGWVEAFDIGPGPRTDVGGDPGPLEYTARPTLT